MGCASERVNGDGERIVISSLVRCNRRQELACSASRHDSRITPDSLSHRQEKLTKKEKEMLFSLLPE